MKFDVRVCLAKIYKNNQSTVDTVTPSTQPTTASVPLAVFWVGAGGVSGSVPDLRSTLSGVKHHRAEGHTDYFAPRGVMKVSIASRSLCELSEIHL